MYWIRVGSDWYKVVGILENTAALRDAGGDDVNNYLFIPLSTAMQRYGEKIQDEQEVLSYLADILIDTYASESAVLRGIGRAR